MATSARTEFSSALNAIATERGLNPTVVLDTIKQAILAAYRRDVRERGEDATEQLLEAEVDSQTGEARILTWEEGKEDKKQDITPPGFGRIAAQTAKQVILQKIREAEKDAIMSQYEGRVGSLVSGIVLRFDGPNVRVDIGRTEGTMLPSERVPNERLNLNQRLTFLLKEIKETERGKEIILSRADPEIVKRLFAREVPEIASGAVEVKAIAREAGGRTKVAVVSTQSGVDPVGSCVGQKGVRVQAVINELSGEKVDVIPWSDEADKLIASALSPATSVSIELNEKAKEATVKVPEDQLSLAIGKEGQNVRLASRLSGWRIEIVKLEGEKKEEVKEKETEMETPKEPKTKAKSKKTPEIKTEEVVSAPEDAKVEEKVEDKNETEKPAKGEARQEAAKEDVN